jgi:hypothetical protein
MKDDCPRWDIINHVIKKMGYKTYLEVGVRKGACFMRVRAEEKTGVDPASPVEQVHKMTSDAFFEENEATFDIVFVDGDHRWPQATRDVLNSLKVLNPGGTIVMHDCKAPVKKHATSKHTTGLWNGTVWRAFSMLRITRPDLAMWTVDTDHGVGIVRKGSQEPYKMDNDRELTHDYYRHYMKAILNLVTPEEFFEEVVPTWEVTDV